MGINITNISIGGERSTATLMRAYGFVDRNGNGYIEKGKNEGYEKHPSVDVNRNGKISLDEAWHGFYFDNVQAVGNFMRRGIFSKNQAKWIVADLINETISRRWSKRARSLPGRGDIYDVVTRSLGLIAWSTPHTSSFKLSFPARDYPFRHLGLGCLYMAQNMLNYFTHSSNPEVVRKANVAKKIVEHTIEGEAKKTQDLMKALTVLGNFFAGYLKSIGKFLSGLDSL